MAENPGETPDMRPGHNGGGSLKTGGVHANSGRPKNEWRDACRGIVGSDKVLELAKQVIEDPGHSAWLGALKWIGEQGYGKAKEEIDLTGKVDHEHDLSERAIEIAYQEMQARKKEV